MKSSSSIFFLWPGLNEVHHIVADVIWAWPRRKLEVKELFAVARVRVAPVWTHRTRGNGRYARLTFLDMGHII